MQQRCENFFSIQCKAPKNSSAPCARKKLEYAKPSSATRRANGDVVANVIGAFDEKGELTEIRGYIFDDTKRKKLEEQFFQSQKMEAIGNLAGGISHDFNNLLSAIVLYSEMLLDDLPTDDPMRSHLEEIMKAIDRSSALTRQLLVFSRTQILETTILELNEVVVDMEKMLRRLIGEDIELSTALSPERGHVKANAGHIEQIIMNLVVNARDAMPNGGQIIIETANVDIDATYAQQHLGLVPGACVMLAVSDTGCGMDAETQSHIFEPFFTTKTPDKGTGLGLSTVYGIVKQCGGQISVYSEIGRGTTFKIYLPRIEQAAAAAKRESALLQTPRGAETILLVEDEDVVRNLTRLALVKAGYRVLRQVPRRRVLCKFANATRARFI
jgi:signal transduction histidine kinase